MGSFHYEAGRLICEQVPVASLARRFGTPTYIYSQAALLENFRRLSQCFSGVRNLICYSVKANSNLRILSLLRSAGAGFDVVSGGELLRALRAGGKPDQIVFSGVGKTAAEADAGLRAGILMFIVASASVVEFRHRTSGDPTYPPTQS